MTILASRYRYKNIDAGEMNITFQTRKLQKVFNTWALLVRDYGEKQAKVIARRMSVLANAPTLQQVPAQKPERCHKLTNNRKHQYAVDALHPFRIVFKVNHNPIPLLEDGGIDLSLVTNITICEVVNYHGG
ncbi:hypothetical protein S1001342_01230 [Acetobacter pasteurianus subsp. pasteurianus]|uniref:Uncharacterized protein n=1 Tax=Acetobacter pasteurianus subsp. pasteurianus TaxID=481145 RepID=A0A1Y0XZL2_ACEPA|nr:hypothetical protein S1001342_01230 [Acetobacter pasteurianus subsp. pasteurianus]